MQQGLNFRATSGFVTDISPATFQVTGSINYPFTSPQGNAIGVETISGSGIGTRDRNASLDARLAGINFQNNDGSSFAVYRIALPLAGTYNIRLAAGDASGQANVSILLKDSATTFATITGTTSAANRWFDATNVERTNITWPTSNVILSRTFTSTIFRIQVGPLSAAFSNTIAHVSIESVVDLLGQACL